MPTTLSVIAGPQAGRCFTFERHDTFLIGRSPEAHFSLPDDDYFSRMHCLIEVNTPRCHLTDLDSRNGTYVNGERVQAAELKDGDEIRGGKTIFKVSITGAANRVTLDLPGAGDTALLTTVAPTGGVPLWPEIPGLQLTSLIGRGGMGEVYRAVRDGGGAEVAVKAVQTADVVETPALGRFLREASIMEKLRHPNIVAAYGSGAAGPLIYFVMEYVPGVDAGRLLEREGPLPASRAVRLTLQTLLALDHAHREGVIHRDVKPANLLVYQAGGRERVKLADFGLARAYQDSAIGGLTLVGARGGTPSFMPPEQITDFRGARPAADQYAAAATLYHLLTGRLPHEAPTIPEVFRKVLTEEAAPLGRWRPDVPPGLASVVQRAMARRPEERFPEVKALAQALVAFG